MAREVSSSKESKIAIVVRMNVKLYEKACWIAGRAEVPSLQLMGLPRVTNERIVPSR